MTDCRVPAVGTTAGPLSRSTPGPGMRARLARTVPTAGRLDGGAFLSLGAVVGLVGWTVTAALAGADRGPARWVALGVWTVLVAVMVGAGLFLTPDAVRFSTPLAGWGLVNGAASTVTAWAVLTGAPAPAVARTWLAAHALGYGWTAGTLRRAGQGDRAGGYGYAALLAGGLLVFDVAGLDALAPVRYPLLAVVHALPLALDARGHLDGLAGRAVLCLAVVTLAVTGSLL